MTCCWPTCEAEATHLLASGMRPWQLCAAHVPVALEYRPGSKVVRA